MCYCLRVRGAQRKLDKREERRRARRREGEGDVASERGSVGHRSKDDEEEVGGEGEEDEEDSEGVKSDAGDKDKEIRGKGVKTDNIDKEDEGDKEARRLKDCCELALFNDEQKRLLEEIQELLKAKEDKDV
jgi:hypothetical protein